MFSRQQVIDALSKVIYPGSEDIVTLGMVDSIEVSDEGISIVLKSQRKKDPVISSIKHACTKAVKDHLGPDAVISSIEVIGRPEPEAEKPETESATLPGVKNIIAIASGKGGVGKSTISVNIAISLARMGHSVGLLDADIFGPSAPKMFNAEDFRPAVESNDGVDLIIPLEKYGVKVLSVGFFVDPKEAVVWRGPMASNFLKQMMTQGKWGDLDFLIVDLPPGTSDIHLTLVQELSVTGAVIVSTPQEVALADAVKGISMFTTEKVGVPVLGLVENMSWFTPVELPENRYYIFGKEGCKKLAEELKIPLLGQIPIVQGICESGDSGIPVALGDNEMTGAFDNLTSELIKNVELRNKRSGPTKRVELK